MEGGSNGRTYAEHSSEVLHALTPIPLLTDLCDATNIYVRGMPNCRYSPTPSGEENFVRSRSEGEMRPRPPNQRAAVTFWLWKDGGSCIIVSPFLDRRPPRSFA